MQKQRRAEDQAVGFFQGPDGVFLEAPAFQADEIEPVGFGTVTGYQKIGGNIFRDRGSASDDTVGPDAGKLMNTGQAADNRVIFHMDMAGQIGRIDHDDMMTQLAVVSDMTIGHNQVMVAHDRDPDIRHRCAMDRDKFPNGIIISDHDPGGLPSELQVLGLNTDRSKLKDTASLADIGMGLNDYMGTDDGIFPDMDIRTDNRIGTNFNPLR
jgi:hypothetical protein